MGSCSGSLLHREAVHRCKAQRPQDAQRVLPEAHARVSHAADNALPQILLPAEGIHQPAFRMIGHGVDGEIPPGQVLPHIGNEGHAIRVAMVGICAVHPEGGYFIGHVVDDHGQGAMLEPRFHHVAIPEHPLHFLRRGRGAHIPILGRDPQQGIPHAPAHHIRLVPRRIQPLQEPCRRLWYLHDSFTSGLL